MLNLASSHELAETSTDTHPTKFERKTDFSQILARVLNLYKNIDVHSAVNSKAKPNILEVSFVKILNKFPSTLLERTFALENDDGPLHQIADHLSENIFQSEQNNNVWLKYLTLITGKQDPCDPLDDKSSNSGLQQLINKLTSADGLKKLFLYEKSQPENKVGLIGGDRQLKWLDKEFQDKEIWRRFMRKVLLRKTGITDPELADSYIYSASFHKHNQAEQLLNVIEKINTLGQEKLKTLREFCGIYALNSYSYDQLQCMLKLAEGDPEEINRLQECDTQIVFINFAGDYNASSSASPSVYDDDSKRTLFFEPQGWGDIYRYMIKLNEKRIKPAKLALVNHGGENSSSIVKKPPISETEYIYTTLNAVQSNDSESRIKYLIRDAAGFVRMYNDYMQPSRNIDDPAIIKGFRVIIFDACKQAVEKQDEIGQLSIMSRLAAELTHHELSSPFIFFGTDRSQNTVREGKGIVFITTVDGVDERRMPSAISLVDGKPYLHYWNSIPISK